MSVDSCQLSVVRNGKYQGGPMLQSGSGVNFGMQIALLNFKVSLIDKLVKVFCERFWPKMGIMSE